jgi:hypothetical protein
MSHVFPSSSAMGSISGRAWLLEDGAKAGSYAAASLWFSFLPPPGSGTVLCRQLSLSDFIEPQGKLEQIPGVLRCVDHSEGWCGDSCLVLPGLKGWGVTGQCFELTERLPPPPPCK